MGARRLHSSAPSFQFLFFSLSGLHQHQPYYIIFKLKVQSGTALKSSSFRCPSRAFKEHMLGIVLFVSTIANFVCVPCRFYALMVENTTTGKNVYRIIIYAALFLVKYSWIICPFNSVPILRFLIITLAVTLTGLGQRFFVHALHILFA
jgi:uncharacterized MAPEG superfamily protein